MMSNLNKRVVQVFGLMVLLLVSSLQVAAAAAGDIERVSVDSSGGEGNSFSRRSSISTNGRFVAFESDANNLVSDDNNDSADIFVHDRETGETTRVSLDSNEVEGNDNSRLPAISGNGRFVAFYSLANNLVSDDNNDTYDVFVHDRETGETERVSVDSNGAEANADSFSASLSEDGRFVAFASNATNLVDDDNNGFGDTFVHDRETGETTRVSVDSNEVEGNGHSGGSAMSADGRFVGFFSSATNLVSEDNNGVWDVFVHDRETGKTTRVSVDSNGVEGDEASLDFSLSADGRYVAFDSDATNLVDDDNNLPSDVFVHDRETGETTRVSVDSNGVGGNHNSFLPSISANGRFVTFESNADNLVSNDNNLTYDVFVHDRLTGETTRVSVISFGTEDNLGSFEPSISGNGRFVAFHSDVMNLINGDTNESLDVFVAELTHFNPVSCDVASGYNVIYGTPGNDRLVGTPDNDIIFGYGGHDHIEGLAGNDCIIGGEGNDRIYGHAGNDIIWGGEENNTIVYDRSDRDRLYGGEGDDEIHAGGDHDHLEGDEGHDALYGDDGNDGLHGDDGNDVMAGGNGRDRMEGHDGDDEMYGGADDDTLTGRDGNDIMHGDGGKDRLSGGDGDDELHGGSEDDRLEGEEGNDRLFGNSGKDSLKGHDGDDYIEGGSEDDDINGGRDNDVIYGDGGNDRIQAERGNDIVYGGLGDDILDGHDGDDHLYGDEGDDELKGGKGADLLDGGDNVDELDGGHDDDTCLNGEDLRSCELP